MRRGALLGLIVPLALSACSFLIPGSSCAPTARMATPVQGQDLARLQALADSIDLDDLVRHGWHWTMVDASESRGTVIVGFQGLQPAACGYLHERYGPLIEAIEEPPAQPF